MGLLYSQGISLRASDVGSFFPDVIGDTTNLGIGGPIESGHYSTSAAIGAFNDDGVTTNWQSENPATTASWVGWDYSANDEGAKLLCRQWSIQQYNNATNDTAKISAAVLEYSDNLTEWHEADSRTLSTAFSDGYGPVERFDVAVPVLARAWRIRATALTPGGGGNPPGLAFCTVAEVEFIENIAP